MVEAEVVVQTPSGLHARPAALLYQTVRRFQSRLTIRNLDKPTSTELAITPVNLLLADVNQGQRIRLCADGPDEQAGELTLHVRALVVSVILVHVVIFILALAAVLQQLP